MLTLLILVCLAAFLVLLWLLRRDRISLGLPIAYLYSLLFIHVPGAFAHVAGRDVLLNSDLTEIAMRFTALGSVCFVVGVWFARSSTPSSAIRRHADRHHFWWFCLIAGWVCVYGLSPLYYIPSVNAATDKGGTIWMLGVLLGLRFSLQKGDRKRTALWLGALMVYPVLMLLLGGFLSYGSAAIIVVSSALTISTRSYWRVLAAIAAFTFLSLSIFVNYYQHRKSIREQVWGGAPLAARIDPIIDTARDFELFDPTNLQHLNALDQRLNQNYFVGLAARRIDQGQTTYLDGESVWDGLLALVPRILWPDKPVFGGSPQIVSRMTGLRFDPQTSIGVGNVMEFQINFGFTGVVVGFLVLGWLIGKLDHKAAMAEHRGDVNKLVLCFLPCVALIQPNGSIVEITGGGAAALVAAYGWTWAWSAWGVHRATSNNKVPSRRVIRFISSVEK